MWFFIFNELLYNEVFKARSRHNSPRHKYTSICTHTNTLTKLSTRTTVLPPAAVATTTAAATTRHSDNSDGSINGHFRHCQRNLFIFINFRNVYEFSSFRIFSSHCICLPLLGFLQYITFDVDLVFALFQSDCKYFTSAGGFAQRRNRRVPTAHTN